MAQTHLALVQPKTGPLAFVGVVMPYKPPIDKIVALMILQGRNDLPIETITYWKRNECAPEDFARWRDEHLYPLDAGDRKYHTARVGSACEFVVKEFGIALGDDGIGKVVEMINHNNKWGSLKKRPYAIAHMLREMYELSDVEAHHIEVISKTVEVVEAYVRVEDGEVHQSVEGLDEVLADLVEKFKGCDNAPLTLGRYLRDLWILGETPSDLRQKIAFWTDGADKLQKKYAEAKEAFEKLDLKSHEFTAGGKRGVVIRTDDRFLAGAVIRSGRYAIRMIVGSAGNTVITTLGLDLSTMSKELAEKEPGRWYYQERQATLINGGPQYVGVRATSLSPVRLIGLLQKHLAQPKKK